MNSFLNELSAQYFEETSKRILDAYFPEYGFKLFKSGLNEVVYKKSDIYFNIAYNPEDSPNYSLLIGMGFIGEVDNFTVYEGGGLYYALPKDYDYKDWFFSNKKELENNLVLLCNDVFEQYAKPLWESPGKLRELINTQQAEIETNYKEQEKDQFSAQARMLYKTKHYGEAIKFFEKIGLNNLSNVEQKMYYICKKYNE